LRVAGANLASRRATGHEVHAVLTAKPPERSHITTFHLLRLADESGVSGVGWVAEGAVFSNGWVVLVWPTGTPSLNFYESIEAVEAVHGHGGLTRIVFDEDA
jgi:hypothetical protein